MTGKRFGRRFKECREKLGLTQAEFADKVKVPPNYISTVERGGYFPRYDKMIQLLNGLEVSADAVFCDVVDHSMEFRASELSSLLEDIPAEEKQEILEVVEVMIKHAKERIPKEP